MNFSTMQDSRSLAGSDAFSAPSKEGLTDRFRQKISAVGRRGAASRESRVSQPDLTYLTARSEVRYYSFLKENTTKSSILGTSFTCS